MSIADDLQAGADAAKARAAYEQSKPYKAALCISMALGCRVSLHPHGDCPETEFDLLMPASMFERLSADNAAQVKDIVEETLTRLTEVLGS